MSLLKLILAKNLLTQGGKAVKEHYEEEEQEAQQEGELPPNLLGILPTDPQPAPMPQGQPIMMTPPPQQFQAPDPMTDPIQRAIREREILEAMMRRAKSQ